MICRGGIAVGGWGDVAPAREVFAPTADEGPRLMTCTPPRVRWIAVVISIAVTAAGLMLLPGRATLPPLIESDYCYQLIAADRLLNGKGLTSLQPAAPHQPWNWEYDWGFLTQWPVGFSILVATVRWSIGVTTMEACRLISVWACAMGLVGWFVFTRRCVPLGVTGVLLAGVAAAASVNVGFLVNPSTDVILAAALPWILLLVTVPPSPTAHRRAWRRMMTAGLLAGSLFWIRYASVFVPAAIACFMLLESFRGRRRLRDLGVFLGSALLPMASLVLVNRWFGPSSGVSEQFNLGSRLGFDFSWERLARAWWMYTDLGYFDYIPAAHWVCAFFPFGVMALFLVVKPLRIAFQKAAGSSTARLCGCLVVTLLAMLVLATALFGTKFDYVGLERYYLPIRPLYFVLFVGPLLWLPRRTVRMMLCAGFLSAAWWTLAYDWGRTYPRWVGANRPVSPYGAWSRCFEPGASTLYGWLKEENRAPGLIVISNFHEYVALETGIAALPIPADEAALHNWIIRISNARGVRPRVLFVLAPDNNWRDHWIPTPKLVIDNFSLVPCAEAPASLAGYVFELPGNGRSAAGGAMETM